ERSIGPGLQPEPGSPEGRRQRMLSFWIPLQLDTPPRETLVFQYRFVRVEKAELHEALYEECPELDWQYDEVDVVEGGESSRFRHSILFTRGLELRLEFKDFDFATMRPMEESGESIGRIPITLP